MELVQDEVLATLSQCTEGRPGGSHFQMWQRLGLLTELASSQSVQRMFAT